MRITLHGAAGGEVTGSAYLVETARARILVDCGLFQGGKNAEAKNRAPGGVAGGKLDAVLLTHGHLDHTGRLPLLAKVGFTGPIYATHATIELTGLILRDAAKIQMQDTERMNRQRQRTGQPPIEPLYTAEEAERILRLLRPVKYDEPVAVAPGVHRFAEAGHMLGSTSIQIVVEEDGREKTVVFSGDLGPRSAPILREFEAFKQADVVFLESTYGDRDHRSFADTVREFTEILKTVVQDRGKILIPTFAVGRAQLITMLLASAFRQKIVKPFPVYLDSPMAIEASRIYANHVELFDDDMLKFIREGSVRRDLATMQTSTTADESRKINDAPGPCLVMAGAGMCTAGRILHHFRFNLWRPETHVVIVGFQSHGSLGRRLVDGVKQVSIFGEKIAVKAHVHTLSGFSAHAGQTDLLHWFDAIAPSRPRVALTHGEDMQRRELARQIHSRHGIRALLPALREVIEV